MNTIAMPGFSAECALPAARGGYRLLLTAPQYDDRGSVQMARVRVSGPGGSQCELDSTLIVEEDGGTSTTNIWKCTTTIDMGGGEDPGVPVPSSEGGGGGSGSGSGGTPRPAPVRKYDPSDGGKCRASIRGMTINNGTYRYDNARGDYDCCGPKIYKPNGEFLRQDCVICHGDVRRCQNQ